MNPRDHEDSDEPGVNVSESTRLLGGESETDPNSSVREAPKIGILHMLLYGFPDLSSGALTVPTSILINKFYTDTLMVPIGPFAFATAIARSFDTIVDPLIGWFSDNCNSPWGRRKPFIAVAAPLCAITFYLLFTPPEMSEDSTVIWFGVFFSLYFFFSSLLYIPYLSLGAEIVKTYHDRSILFAIKHGFSAVGVIFSAIGPGLITIHMSADNDQNRTKKGYTVMALAVAIALTLSFLLLVSFVAEPQTESGNPIVPGIRRALRNKAFSNLLPVYIVGTVVIYSTGNLLPYFVSYVIQPPDEEHWMTLYLGVLFGCALLSIPIWLKVSMWIGKKRAMLVGWVLLTAVGVSLFFLGKGDYHALLVLQIIAGFSGGGWSFLFLSIQSDVIDYDEFRTGIRREGQYMTFWALIPKFISIASAAIPFAILSAAGYVPNQEQNALTLFWIRALMALLPAVCAALAFITALKFPITQSVFEEIRKGIDLHKQNLPAVDPITKLVVDPPEGMDTEMGWFLDHFSLSELRHSLERPDNVILRVLVEVGVWSIICIVSIIYVIESSTSAMDAHQEMGLSGVLGVLLFSLSFTMTIFHILRIKPARRLQFDPPSRKIIKAHISLIADDKVMINDKIG